MALTEQDREAITDLINLHGHVTDAGSLSRYAELFTPDVVYDVDDFGMGTLHGPAAVREAALALGGGNPVGHHITNIVITPIDDRSARVRSKGIGIMADGAAGSAVYEDIVSREPAGWRISHRKVTARRTPLGGPREVLSRWRQAVIDQSVSSMTSVYAIDAVHEFPFSRPGWPSRLEGRAEIMKWTTAAWTAAFKYESYRTLAVYETPDPSTIIVEQEAVGRSAATGEFVLPNMVVLTTRNGEIVHLRDYVNVVAAEAAIGQDL